MSTIQTQTQRDMALAATRVNEIQGKSWAKNYGSLCHSFPVLVKTAGLAQALAFHQSKAGDDKEGDSDRKQAHSRILSDASVLLPGFSPATAPLGEYMRATRRVLAAWVFYKRFAVSILEVKDGSGDDT